MARVISTSTFSDIVPKVEVPEANDSFFYTAGRMLSYGKPTKNGIVFFREDCLPVVDTLRSALSNIAHVKPGNEGVPDPYRLGNGSIGSIYSYFEDDDGIDIVCKNDKLAVKTLGFELKDFAPDGKFSSYSQESEYQFATSPYISIPMDKVRQGIFSTDDIVKTYSYQEGQQLGLYPSSFDSRIQKWNYCKDPEGNVVFVRVRPTSFTGVGHVIHPADDSAEIYRYMASVEGEELIAQAYGKQFSGYPGMDTPEIVAASLDNYSFGNNYADDFIEHSDLRSPAQDLSSIDLNDTFESDDNNHMRPSTAYDPEADNMYIHADDLKELKAFSRTLSKVADGDKKVYPLDTPERVKAAADYFANPKTHKKYTASERAHIQTKIAAAQAKHKIGAHSNESYSAVWTTQHPEKQGKFMVNRRFRMVDDNGNLDRSKLVSAYHALSGVRGHTALVNDMPQPVRDHALALVRQGLHLTKPNKELSMNTDLTPALTAEIEELKARAQALSQEKDSALAAKDTELTALRQEFSSYKESNETLVTELKDQIAALQTEVGTFKSRELSQARLAQLEAVHPFTAEEKTEDFVKSLSSISEDRLETLLVRRELAKTKAEGNRAFSSAGLPAPSLSPTPTFEGFGKQLEIKTSADIL